ncbi:MAG: diacylglycerol kinase family protein [Desulfatiglandaceae bacterium]
MLLTSYAFIVNPRAGRGMALPRARALCAALGGEDAVELFQTTEPGSGSDLAASAAGSVDRIIAVGGDGTLNEVLNGLVQAGRLQSAKPAIGMLPAGTGNAAAGALGLTASPLAMAAALKRVDPVHLDAGRVVESGRAFFLWLGAGVDAVVMHALNAARTNRMGFGGILRQLPGIIRVAAGYPEPPIKVEMDNAGYGPYADVVVANFGNLPLGRRLTGSADPRDGFLNVIGVPKCTQLQRVLLGMRLIGSTLAEAGAVREYFAASISLTSAGAVPVQLDGEPAGHLPATIETIPRAVCFLGTRAGGAHSPFLFRLNNLHAGRSIVSPESWVPSATGSSLIP